MELEDLATFVVFWNAQDHDSLKSIVRTFVARRKVLWSRCVLQVLSPAKTIRPTDSLAKAWPTDALGKCEKQMMDGIAQRSLVGKENQSITARADQDDVC